MKRTRLEDSFNPVYPYDTDSSTPSVPFVTPPFVSSEGLEENPPGVLAIKYTDPLTTNNKGQLGLKLGGNMSITNGELTAIVPSVAPPLTNNNNTLGLTTSAPLALNNDSLSINLNAPLNVSNNKLNVSLGNGLVTTASKLAVRAAAPLTFDTAGNLQLQTARPLQITNNTLGLDVGYGMIVGQAVSVNIDRSKGLQFDSARRLIVQLGSGLRFDGTGRIALSSARSMPSTPQYLATASTPNCSIKEPLDSQLNLHISKTGTHALGTVSIATFQPLQTNILSLQLRFNRRGQLLPGPLDPAYWSSSESTNNEAQDLMPNSTLYQTKQTLNTQSPDGSLTITLEAGVDDGYAITFKWSATPGEVLQTPTCMFSYVTE
ncbi:short fiber-1 [Simian adenovirus 17]|uniref:Fiber-1 n=1 Tax=Simian adenovirus 17 TaxID=1715779 RepID=A0A2H4CJX8_9ADEN|nr:short fiber-1 [Simian adenovirus 17]